jgi:hypothetical protein
VTAAMSDIWCEVCRRFEPHADRDQLAVALKERDEARAQRCTHDASDLDRRFTQLRAERDEARSERNIAEATNDRLHKANFDINNACVAVEKENACLRAALELTAENFTYYEDINFRAYPGRGAVEILAAIRARAGLEQLDHGPGHRKQGDEQAAGEHEAPQLLGLAVGGQDVDHHADEGHQQRDDERDSHGARVRVDRGGGKEG